MKQTKYLYLITLAGLYSFSCQNQSVNESMASTDPNDVRVVENAPLFSGVPLSTGKICNPVVGQNCSHEVQQLQLKLMTLNPIPMPREGEPAKLSINQATELYKNFVADHANEPIVSVFRQLYARILLNQYGVLASKDYRLIQFYGSELTDENSLDFATLTEVAGALQGRIADNEFADLVNKTTKRAQAFNKARQQLTDELTLAMQKDPKSTTKEEPRTAKFLVDKMKQSTIALDVNRLIKLQSSLNKRPN